MKNYKYIIGIDPDCDKSGFCMIDTSDRTVNICSKTFPHLLDTLRTMQGIEGVIVIVEAGYLHAHNWHVSYKDSKAKAAAKGNAVGRNHEVARKIVEMCKHYGIEVVEQLPLVKTWNGPEKKITHAELKYFINDIPPKTNQEERDATLLAWNYAGYPIRVKPISAKAK